MKYPFGGPDVSFYQDDPATPRGIDFDLMKAAGSDLVIIRAGQRTWADRDVKKNWAAAKGKLPRGAYWFYDSREDPKKQAALCLSLLGDDLGELPLWCDFEDKYGGPFGRWQDWYDFMEELKALRPGIRLGVYTNYFYWSERTIGKGITTASLNYFKQYPLWIAAYNPVGPKVPEPWIDWTLWQYTDKGNGPLYGVESKNIDLNYFNGDAEAFANFAGAVLPAPDVKERLTLYLQSGAIEMESL